MKWSLYWRHVCFLKSLCTCWITSAKARAKTVFGHLNTHLPIKIFSPYFVDLLVLMGWHCLQFSWFLRVKPPQIVTLGNLSTRRFLRGDGNRKSNLLPIHVSRRQSRPSRLCADFVLLILTSPVKREFCFYDFRAFISFCLRSFALSDT